MALARPADAKSSSHTSTVPQVGLDQRAELHYWRKHTLLSYFSCVHFLQNAIRTQILSVLENIGFGKITNIKKNKI